MRKSTSTLFALVLSLVLLAGAIPADARTYVVPVWYGFVPYATPYYYAVNTVRNHPYYYGGYPFVYPYAYGYPWNRYYPSFNNPVQWSWSWYSAAATPSYWGGGAGGGTVGWVNTSSLNLRSSAGLGGKSRNSNVIGSMVYGERVYVTGQDGNWYFVQSIDQPGKQGYVSRDFISGSSQGHPTSWSGGAYYYPGSYAAAGWTPVPFRRVSW